MSALKQSDCGTRSIQAGCVRTAIAQLRELPATAAVVREALDAAEDPLCATWRLQDILSRDTGASADLLRLANSAYFGLRSEVRTLSMAVSVVGYSRLCVLLRHLLACKLLEHLPIRSALALRVRNVGLAAAVAAYELGRQMRRPDADELLIAGMLHNVGELVLLSEFPAEYERVVQLSAKLSRREAEFEVFGITSSTAGEWLLRAWHFPPTFIEAAVSCDSPQDPATSDFLSPFPAVVRIAAEMARAWVEECGEDRMLESVSALDQLSLIHSPDVLREIYRRMDGGLKSIRGTL